MRNDLQHILGGDLARYWPGGVLVRLARPKPAAVADTAAPRWERGWHVRSELSADRFATVHGATGQGMGARACGVNGTCFVPERPAPARMRA